MQEVGKVYLLWLSSAQGSIHRIGGQSRGNRQRTFWCGQQRLYHQFMCTFAMGRIVYITGKRTTALMGWGPHVSRGADPYADRDVCGAVGCIRTTRNAALQEVS